jgi:glycosyltransferase involved in cell wall biosynthesis
MQLKLSAWGQGLHNVRVAVVSPFVDKQHGTERAVAEAVEYLARDCGYEITLYSQRVADVPLIPSQGTNPKGGGIIWRKVETLPGPHLVQFLFWYLRNYAIRSKDTRKMSRNFDVIFSAGINCSDANVILVHAVFHQLAKLQAQSRSWNLRSIHRRLYYAVLCALERKIYSDRRVAIAAVSQRTAGQLNTFFGREDVLVIPNGVDTTVFTSGARQSLRIEARRRWNYSEQDVVALLVGNDWQNKGLLTLLRAMATCGEPTLRLLVVGADRPSDWQTTISSLGLEQKISFAPSAERILEYYAAADLLVAPSLEDSFNLPVLEAMACCLPVIASSAAGVSGFLRNGVDCFLLEQPTDSDSLASLLSRLVKDAPLRQALGQRATQTAALFSWKKSVEKLAKFMEESKQTK